MPEPQYQCVECHSLEYDVNMDGMCMGCWYNQDEMTIDATKQDLTSMVLGMPPNYSVMEHELVKPHGRWIGGHVDEWSWDGNSLDELTEEQLWDLYRICRDSWNE